MMDPEGKIGLIIAGSTVAGMVGFWYDMQQQKATNPNIYTVGTLSSMD